MIKEFDFAALHRGLLPYEEIQQRSKQQCCYERSQGYGGHRASVEGGGGGYRGGGCGGGGGSGRLDVDHIDRGGRTQRR